MSFSIEIHNVSKSYQLDSTHKVYALNQLSLHIKKGETIGIIGKNGAGKSTLLKLLAELAYPDKGKIILNGKVLAILDLGTGFNPEFTGYQNIYFVGSIFGLNQHEIKALIPTIETFSGLGNFLNYPVKTYSTGMFVRLAFSTISHLNADIILLDEIITAGDTEFGFKSRKKIEWLKSQGKTMVITSHNLNEVLQLCDRFVILEAGQIISNTKQINDIRRYIKTSFEHSQTKNLNLANKNEFIEIKNCQIISNQTDVLLNTQPFFLQFEVITNKLDYPISLAVRLKNFSSEGFITSPYFFKKQVDFLNSTSGYVIKLHFPAELLNEGEFSVDLLVMKEKAEKLGEIKDFFSFRIEPEPDLKTDEFSLSLGAIKPNISWTITQNPTSI